MSEAAWERYVGVVLAQLRQVQATQGPALRAAARMVADALAQDGWLYVFGSGHSHLMAGELFYRAGGLARVAPIFHGPLMLHEGAARSSELEREEGYAARVLADYPLGARDVLVVVSNSGRNPVPIELALLARERGARTIGLVSARHMAAFPSRHRSGQRLGEVVDLVLDNCGVPGDAALTLEGLEEPVGPTSTITGALLLEALVVQAVEELLAAGRAPEVWQSANLGAGQYAARNQQLLERYRGRVRHL